MNVLRNVLPDITKKNNEIDVVGYTCYMYGRLDMLYNAIMKWFLFRKGTIFD